MQLERMLNILENNSYEPDNEDYSLVMHDIYITHLHNPTKGEKGFKNLINMMKFNIKEYRGYKNDNEISEFLKRKLSFASKHIDKIIGSGNRVEAYYTDAIKNLKEY